MAVETLILRFRDLVTDPNETIASHRAIIEEAGYTWWAWWNKMGEKVPAEVFSELNQQINDADSLALYLMDSGQELLYSARCSEIEWSNDLGKRMSPEPEKTPEYYRPREYRAWFKLTSIDEVPEENPDAILHELGYERVDEFFTSGRSHYGAFYQKRVYSVGELRQQDRTIWFVRAATQDDALYEVALFGASTTTPRDFVLDPVKPEAPTFLWISDVHVDAGGEHHSFPRAAQEGSRTLAAALEEDLKALNVEQLGGLLVSGDLTWQATDADFEEAKTLLRSVQSWARLSDPHSFVVCPGNHDLAFSPDPSDRDAAVEAALPEAKASYVTFYTEFFQRSPNEYLAMGRRYLVAGSRVIDIAALNTSYLQQHREMFQGQGWVGSAQLDLVAEEMGWNEQGVDNRAYRVIVLHHHLVPVVDRETPEIGKQYSLTLDAGAVLRWAVSHRVDLVLHGHMHQPYCGLVTLPLKSMGELDATHTMGVVALGSSGVAEGHRGEIGQNFFGVLDFDAEGVRVRMFPIAPGMRLNPENAPFLERLFSYGRTKQ